MKKEDISGLLVYLLILVIAVVFGLTILRDLASNCGLNNGAFFGYVVAAIVTGVIFNSILFEIGHVIGAKIGGYEVLSVTVIGFCLYKKDNKWKFKFSNYEGLTGETRILPKKNNDKEANPIPYSLFGTLIFVVELTVLITLFIVFNNIVGGDRSKPLALVAYFLLTVAVLGLMILIYNVVPFHLDTDTDGYRLKLMSNPKNKEAFNELLRVKHAIENGESDVEVKTFTTITDFTADLNLNKAYSLLDQNKFEEALPFINDILNNQENVSNKVYLRTTAQKIYILIMTKTLEEAQEFYDKDVPVNERREISKDVSMASIRAYILMSGLLDKSLSETELALNKVMKAFKRTPKNRQPIELKLYNEALKRVIEAHPSWNLEGFLLEEK